MRVAKIEIKVIGNQLEASVTGNTLSIIQGLTSVMAKELNDSRKPGVTNEELANDIRDELLSILNSGELNAN